MPTFIASALRELVITRAGACCEYCLIHQDDVPDTHEIDHIIARKHGGETIAENLALACLACNRAKGADLSSFDPQTQTLVPLFNPRVQNWRDHFVLNGAQVIGLTATGRATVALLRFNTPVRVDNRRWLIEKKRYPPQQ